MLCKGGTGSVHGGQRAVQRGVGDREHVKECFAKEGQGWCVWELVLPKGEMRDGQ